MSLQQLMPHPRLYAKAVDLDRLHSPNNISILQAADATMLREAEIGLTTPDVDYDQTTHNALLIRARHMQQRIVSLAGMWWRTKDKCYHAAILKSVRAMGNWEYWSWIAMRAGDSDPKAIFDLSYGENSATLAIAYDWLFYSLSTEERTMFLDIARKRAVEPFLHCTRNEDPAWWLGKPDSNWNTVCAGGMGMLALSMREELPESGEILRRVQASIVPLMSELNKTHGGWVEGVGYWNYGMRYAFMYLLSWENSTKHEHPLLALEGTRATLQFPLDFSPNGQTTGFGDSNKWSPLPFHFAAARRIRNHSILARLRSALDYVKEDQGHLPKDGWPTATELLIFYPRESTFAEHPTQKNIVKLYPVLDWGIFADQWPHPCFYLSVRGGSSAVPHGQQDLLSFNCVVKKEKLIENITGSGAYLDTTFSSRNGEIFESSPFSKNTLLINGVGITVNSSATTEMMNSNGISGIRINAAQAMGGTLHGGIVQVCERSFLQLGDDVILIIDRIETPHPALVEFRMFTPYKAVLQERCAQIHGEQESLYISFASNHPAVLQSATPPLTWPQAKSRTMLRWITTGLFVNVVFATLITPLKPEKNLAVISLISDNDGKAREIEVRATNTDYRIPLTT